jgi:tetratricopeptide (TPR) repeat protein
MGDLAEALYRQGRHDEADQYAEVVREIAAADDFDPQMRWRAVHAKVLAQRGDFDQAETLSREAVAITADTDWLRHHADVLVDRAEVLQLAGRADDAAQALREAIELYERKQSRPDAQRAKAKLAAIVTY